METLGNASPSFSGGNTKDMKPTEAFWLLIQ